MRDLDGVQFEISYIGIENKVNVHLGGCTCYCKLCDLNGIPCKHVMAIVAFNRLKLKYFVHHYYFTETFKKAYAPFI